MPRPKRKFIGDPERMSPARESWVDLGRFMVMLFDGTVDTESDASGPEYEDVGHGSDLPQYRLVIKFPGTKRPVRISLNALTTAELDALEAFFARAFQLVRPTIAELDKRAQVAFEEGNETYVRLYRPAPQLHVRKRQVPEFNSGVQGGPDGVAGMDGRNTAGGDASSNIPEHDQGSMLPSDDPAEAGGVPSVG